MPCGCCWRAAQAWGRRAAAAPPRCSSRARRASSSAHGWFSAPARRSTKPWMTAPRRCSFCVPEWPPRVRPAASRCWRGGRTSQGRWCHAAVHCVPQRPPRERPAAPRRQRGGQSSQSEGRHSAVHGVPRGPGRVRPAATRRQRGGRPGQERWRHAAVHRVPEWPPRRLRVLEEKGCLQDACDNLRSQLTVVRPGLLSARPMGGRCLCCYGMPHGCDWVAGASARQLGSAYGSDSGQRNSPGLNAQPGAPARAGASHGACNASECSPRLAQKRPSSQPTVHRLLKKHSNECGTGDTCQAGRDAVIGCCVPSEGLSVCQG